MKLLFLFKQKLNICQQGESCEEMKLRESTGIPGLRVCFGVLAVGWSRDSFPFFSWRLKLQKSEAVSIKVLVELFITAPMCVLVTHVWLSATGL